MASQWTGEITASVDGLPRKDEDSCSTPETVVEGFAEPVKRTIKYNLSSLLH
ncbi:hypothetical protein [Pedomonas mirosovicensis]|uniref:hypothetical protein n=1 Tax=Pedomonas mirosovicensis TaxID=2908641 RepID=UPI0021694097|nr:hypothetical protein [Pedomonas mirosovicensis]MCH8686335.1 hypothetical protein [Pedomonas mirosovicensis]